MNNETLITRLKIAERYYIGEVSPLFREAASEIERLEELMKQNNSKHMEVVNNYNATILRLEKAVMRLHTTDKSFPGYETVHIKPEELFGNSGLRDQFACAAVEGLVSNGIYNPESNARWAYQQADAMLKAREK